MAWGVFLWAMETLVSIAIVSLSLLLIALYAPSIGLLMSDKSNGLFTSPTQATIPAAVYFS